jgi:hypothetical protein
VVNLGGAKPVKPTQRRTQVQNLDDGKWLVDLDTGDKISRIGTAPAKAAGSGTAPAAGDTSVAAVVDAIANGDAVLSDFGKRNPQWQAAVVAGVKAKRPDYNFIAAGADAKSLASYTKGVDAILGFEKGVQNSFPIIERLSANYKRGKYPGINKFSQLLAYHTGDPDVRALQNAVTTSMTEYMKVITAGTSISGAELSMGAQARAKEVLSAADNPETLKNTLAVMRQEVEAKKGAMVGQQAEIQGRLRGTQASPPPTQEPMKTMPDPRQSAGRIVRDTTTGKRYKSDGKRWKVVP